MKVVIKYIQYGDDSKDTIECSQVLNSKGGPQSFKLPSKSYGTKIIVLDNDTAVFIDQYDQISIY